MQKSYTRKIFMSYIPPQGPKIIIQTPAYSNVHIEQSNLQNPSVKVFENRTVSKPQGFVQRMLQSVENFIRTLFGERQIVAVPLTYTYIIPGYQLPIPVIYGTVPQQYVPQSPLVNQPYSSQTAGHSIRQNTPLTDNTELSVDESKSADIDDTFTEVTEDDTSTTISTLTEKEQDENVAAPIPPYAGIHEKRPQEITSTPSMPPVSRSIKSAEGMMFPEHLLEDDVTQAQQNGVQSPSINQEHKKVYNDKIPTNVNDPYSKSSTSEQKTIQANTAVKFNTNSEITLASTPIDQQDQSGNTRAMSSSDINSDTSHWSDENEHSVNNKEEQKTYAADDQTESDIPDDNELLTNLDPNLHSDVMTSQDRTLDDEDENFDSSSAESSIPNQEERSASSVSTAENIEKTVGKSSLSSEIQSVFDPTNNAHRITTSQANKAEESQTTDEDDETKSIISEHSVSSELSDDATVTTHQMKTAINQGNFDYAGSQKEDDLETLPGFNEFGNNVAEEPPADFKENIPPNFTTTISDDYGERDSLNEGSEDSESLTSDSNTVNDFDDFENFQGSITGEGSEYSESLTSNSNMVNDFDGFESFHGSIAGEGSEYSESLTSDSNTVNDFDDFESFQGLTPGENQENQSIKSTQSNLGFNQKEEANTVVPDRGDIKFERNDSETESIVSNHSIESDFNSTNKGDNNSLISGKQSAASVENGMNHYTDNDQETLLGIDRPESGDAQHSDNFRIDSRTDTTTPTNDRENSYTEDMSVDGDDDTVVNTATDTSEEIRGTPSSERLFYSRESDNADLDSLAGIEGISNSNKPKNSQNIDSNSTISDDTLIVEDIEDEEFIDFFDTDEEIKNRAISHFSQARQLKDIQQQKNLLLELSNIEPGLIVPDEYNRNLLSWGCAIGIETNALSALAKNSDLSHQDNNGNTALHIAVQAQHPAAVKFLMSQPDTNFVNITNNQGDTARDILQALPVSDNKVQREEISAYLLGTKPKN